MVVLGFDPGGASAFGWAVVEISNGAPAALATGVADHATVAISRALAHVPDDTEAAAAGIDAPLFYSRSGGRRVDELVRAAMTQAGASNVGGTVQHANSLRGACLVQGILAVLELREPYPELTISEAHPKALRTIDQVASSVVAASEHERDAVISSLSAWAAASRPRGWVDISELEPEPYFPFPGRASYFMPEHVSRAA